MITDYTWYVGKIGVIESMAFKSQAEAEAAIAGIEFVDPIGCHAGMYYIDPPSDDMEGPGESSIYSSEL